MFQAVCTLGLEEIVSILCVSRKRQYKQQNAIKNPVAASVEAAYVPAANVLIT
jgi:hypothetical protein